MHAVLFSFQLFFDICMFLEPVAVSPDIDDLAMMQQAVQDCGGDHRITKQLLPIAKAFIRSDDRGVSFVAVRDKLEE